MTFSIGQKVVYPGQGPYRVGAIVQKVVGGKLESYYRLVSLAESSEAVFVPLSKIDGLGIRTLVTKTEVSKILRQLTLSSGPMNNWRQRDYTNLKRLFSGSVYDLAQLIESLTKLNKRRPLAAREQQILQRARTFLICEISEVTGEPKKITEECLDNALNVHEDT